ncbi:MAG: CotH kinase family protein [Myxococcales bacterium]|nr:CotH kinase family protein [Myxococcales bacterium]
MNSAAKKPLSFGHHRVGICLLLMLAMGATAACTSEPSPPPQAAPPRSLGPVDETCAQLGAADPVDGSGAVRRCLFDDHAAPRHFQIDVDPGHLSWLQKHARQEAYVPAQLTFGGRKVAAEVRFKGGDSTLHGCFDDSGALVCPRLSIKVRVAGGGRFMGLRRFIFNSSVRDPTYLRERLSYRLFRDAQVLAPRAVHAWVRLGQRPPALYLLVEDIDAPFLNARFSFATGNLSKHVWFSDSKPDHWHSHQITGPASSAARPVAFATLLDQLKSLEFTEFSKDFVKKSLGWVDLDVLARWLAVDVFIGNWDGPRGRYCGEQTGPDAACKAHNFYVYDDPGSKLLVLIPWDLDLTWPRVDTDMGRDWWLDDACEVYSFGGHTPMQRVQCDPMWLGLTRVRWQAYTGALSTMLATDSVLDPHRIHRLIDRYRAMVAPLLLQDPTAPSVSEWQAEVARLRALVTAQAGQAWSVAHWKPPQ